MAGGLLVLSADRYAGRRTPRLSHGMADHAGKGGGSNGAITNSFFAAPGFGYRPRRPGRRGGGGTRNIVGQLRWRRRQRRSSIWSEDRRDHPSQRLGVLA